LLHERPDEVRITPEVVAAAAGNYRSGREVMQLLLQERPDEVRITPEVVAAAAGNDGSGKEVIQILLQQRPDEIHITCESLSAMAGNMHLGKDLLEMFLIGGKLDLHLADKYGRTLLSWAALRGNERMLDLVLTLNNRPSDLVLATLRDKLGCSMIHFAAMGNCVDRIKKSLNIDQYIHLEDNRCWTALH